MRDGHAVRALVRVDSARAHLERLGCELVVGSITDPVDTLARGMEGCDVIVHAAALVGARASKDRYDDANVTGTANVLTAADAAGVRRAVHVSSVAVYGPITGTITEERWQERDIHPRAAYAASKRMAEIEAWRHHRDDGLRVTTVRPSLIYGERDRHVAPRLDRLARMRVLPLPDGGRHVLPLVYAGNVAAGIVAALERPHAAGRAYNLAQDNAVALRDVVRMWCEAAGTSPPRLPAIPGGAIELGARALDLLSRVVPGVDLPGLRRPARLVREDNPYDSSRARAELGWQDLVPMSEAIPRTVAWLRT